MPLYGGGGTTSPLTTKGDVWGYSTTNARIPAGADSQVLTADSTQTLGMKFATPTVYMNNPMNAGGDMVYGQTLGSDLATGHTGTASSQINAGEFNASNAFDGNFATYWGSSETTFNNQWIYVDLGSATAVTQMTVTENGSPYSWNGITGASAQYSDDASAWTSVATNNSIGNANGFTLTWSSQSHRYWRLLVNSIQNNGQHLIIVEIQLYGGVPGSPLRLPIGSTGNVLAVAGGVPSWATGILGTTTNDNATAGYVGQVITSVVASGSAVALTTATPANITSISLTAGDWDVTGVVDYILTGATTTNFQSGASSTSATFGGQDSFLTDPALFTVLSSTYGQWVPTTRFSLATTTTVYLVAQATFSAGTTTAYGTIRARRAR